MLSDNSEDDGVSLFDHMDLTELGNLSFSLFSSFVKNEAMFVWN